MLTEIEDIYKYGVKLYKGDGIKADKKKREYRFQSYC